MLFFLGKKKKTTRTIVNEVPLESMMIFLILIYLSMFLPSTPNVKFYLYPISLHAEELDTLTEGSAHKIRGRNLLYYDNAKLTTIYKVTYLSQRTRHLLT